MKVIKVLSMDTVSILDAFPGMSERDFDLWRIAASRVRELGPIQQTEPNKTDSSHCQDGILVFEDDIFSDPAKCRQAKPGNDRVAAFFFPQEDFGSSPAVQLRIFARFLL